MAWEQRKDSSNRYYYRSQWLPDGRVIKTYCGTGLVGAQAAEADQAHRAQRHNERQCQRAMLEYVQNMAQPLVELCEACDVIVRAALVAAGYKNHRGEWRKRRHGRHDNAA
jgi:hypothetical protein